MRWQQGRRSSNVEDRRSARIGLMGGGGSMFALALLVFLAGGDPTGLLIEGASQTIQSSFQKLSPEQQSEQSDFTSVVLGNTEDIWQQIFQEHGHVYRDPKLVLYSGVVDSACGQASAAVGPFYCPLDQKVYLDLNFFYDLEYKIDAPGDFARAYVIAHEVGHHVQNLQGVLRNISQEQGNSSEATANQLSVKTELQADCYAGIWASRSQSRFDMIEAGDIDEALKAASQIGDDRLQQESQGYVVPDSFTHGSSEQRNQAFRRGFETGKIEDCAF